MGEEAVAKNPGKAVFPALSFRTGISHRPDTCDYMKEKGKRHEVRGDAGPGGL